MYVKWALYNEHLLIVNYFVYRFEEYGILLGVGERSIRTTADGNCIFNSLSIALYGHEEMTVTLQLASIFNAADGIVPFRNMLG